ncbi:MAG TPA: hypothetical protein VMY42_14085 [Thermoguttaceae bacterium]|nr:hypothetical protein [Thermoguttaceae bacterium]
MKRLVCFAPLLIAALTLSGCPKPPPEEPKPDASKIRKAVLDSLKKAVAEEMHTDDPPPSQGPPGVTSSDAIGFVLPLIQRMASGAAKGPRNVVERTTDSPPTTDGP